MSLVQQELPSQRCACSTLVRHATARVVAAIAEIELPLGQWPALLPALTQAATSSVVSQRETGAFTLCTILEKTGLEMQNQLPDFFKLFSSLAHDNDSLEVRITSVRCVRKGCMAVDFINSWLMGLIGRWVCWQSTLTPKRKMQLCVRFSCVIVRAS
jgi:hypothetical protein